VTSKGFEEAQKRCMDVAQEGGDKLDLSGLRLTELPAEILGCSELRLLDLSDNRLAELPPEVCRLTQLEALYLTSNPIHTLPNEIIALDQLHRIFLEYTRLQVAPEILAELAGLRRLRIGGPTLRNLSVVLKLEKLRRFECWRVADGCVLPDLGALQSLDTLMIVNCGLTALPPWLFQFPQLELLSVGGNRLFAIPAEIGGLAKLVRLDLSHNPLEDLPPEVGALPALVTLDVKGCPLSRLPPEIVEQGAEALLVYLRDQARGGTRQWVSKLLVVGQGGVGKTSLLRALRGDGFDARESSTHGIAVRALDIPHPTKAGVTMALKTWDFGGQQIYHATHQFFLTNRSLFILVWNARHGHEQGRLYYWLDTIRARAPESPVLLVATHVDERSADLPLSDIRQRYPQIVGHYTVSNKTTGGIEALRRAITEEAAKLPLMGERWPRTWLAATEAIRAMAAEETHIAPQKLWRTMEESGVGEDRHRILATWLHELGDMLFFQDNPELQDVVLLDPHWATEALSRVLESNDVIERRGIFTRVEMDKLWSKDIAPHMQEYLLRLMEQFDLSYRTLESREVGIVVERLSQDAPPDLSSRFDKRLGTREVSMRFQIDATLPAGIPTWFIARTHRFTTRTHFRQGALFADHPEEAHLALVQAFTEGRCIHLSVRGPAPHGFFTLLRDGLELTLARFPGLKVERFIPCPGHGGMPCTHEFKFEQLQNRLERKRFNVECPEAAGSDIEDPEVDVREMLFGLSASTHDEVLSRLDMLLAKEDEHLTHIRALTEMVQREFLRAFQAMQRREETHCPSLFVLRPDQKETWKQNLLGQTVELHLVCEAPGEVHLTRDGGRYETQFSPEWLGTIAPYVEAMVSILKYAAPFVGIAVGYAPEQFQKMFGADIRLMQELVKKLPDVKGPAKDSLSLRDHGKESHERFEGAALRVLRSLLDRLDPQRKWGGLRKVLTPEGHYLWLCENHAAAYRV
jgi:internalin A